MSRNQSNKMRRANAQAGQKLAAYAKSELHEAGMDLFQFFETMMNPEDLPPMRVPDSHSGRTAVFKTPLIVDLPYSGVWDSKSARSADIDKENPIDGYSEVILVPGTVDCVIHTLGGSNATIFSAGANILQALVPILSTHPLLTDVVNGRTQIVQGLRTYNTANDNIALLPKFDSLGHAVFECVIISDNAPAENVSFEVQSQNTGHAGNVATTLHITIYFESGETASNSGILNSGIVSGPIVIDWSGAPPGDTDIRGIYFEVEDTDPASHWTITLTNGLFSMAAIGGSACSFAILNAPEVDELAETLSERTTALTGLCTYMGSTLEDGGQVSAARLGMGLSPLRAAGGDVYSYLASLPFFNDDFALREGIYAWWLPSSVQEHFYVPYRNPRSDSLAENSVLQYALLRDKPDQAVRLKVIQNIEAITRSRLYTSTSAPVNPTYQSLSGAMQVIPAVTVNAKHTGILGKALNWVKGWVSKPANFGKLLKGGAGLIQKVAAPFLRG